MVGSSVPGTVPRPAPPGRVGQYTEKIRILCIIRIILYSVLIRFVLLADIIQRTVHVHTAPRRAGQRAKANHKRSQLNPVTTPTTVTATMAAAAETRRLDIEAMHIRLLDC